MALHNVHIEGHSAVFIVPEDMTLQLSSEPSVADVWIPQPRSSSCKGSVAIAARFVVTTHVGTSADLRERHVLSEMRRQSSAR